MKSKLLGFSFCLFLLLSLGLVKAMPATPAVANGNPIITEVWVDAGWAGHNPGDPVDGHTFGTDAFAKIQDGINAVALPGIVHVAAGTYYENITLQDGVQVLGAEASTTTINGGGSGAVVTADSINGNIGPTTKLDGFTITNGSAMWGGGMYNYGSSPTVTNCTFSANSATTSGGGMCNFSSSPTVTNCTFSGNSATYGGGMLNSELSPTVTNCTFSGNSATNSGGGMYNNYSSPTVTNCTFSGNLAKNLNGGGMCNVASSSPAVSNCTFSGNSAFNDGGGMYNSNNSSPTVTNCAFTDNSAEGGGGIYNAQSSPTVTDCTFSGNSATQGGGMNNYFSLPTITACTFSGNSATYGGGMYNFNSSPTVTNCTFSGNWVYSGGVGGGMYNNNNSSPTVTNCTFSGNSATYGNGGGIYNYALSSPTVTNCILWGDSPDEIHNDVNSTPSVTYCDIQGGYGVLDDHNKSDDPKLTADLHLKAGSPCIDAGNNGAVPSGITTDFDGNPRFMDDPAVDDTGVGPAPIVDMGADEEYVQPAEVWVDDDWAGTSSGTIVGQYKTFGFNAFDKIQDGINAVNHSTVHVAAGTYYENITLVDGVEVLGAGASVTTINGDTNSDGTGDGTVVTAISVGSTTKLDGFTITNGSTNTGGGMYNQDSSPTVTNCAFLNNAARGGGGGMFNRNSSPTVTNCIFFGNSVWVRGSGMSNYNNSSPKVTNCTFTGNLPSFGALDNEYSSSPTVTNCIFWNGGDGEIYKDIGSNPAITYCDIQMTSGTYPGTGNINKDPLLVNPATGDFHLQPGSPCIDKGDNGATALPDKDFEGDNRIADGDNLPKPTPTATVDMGVDEVQKYVAPEATKSTLTPTSASIIADGISIQVLTVTAMNLFGNPFSFGGANVTINFKTPPGIGTLSAVADNNDGTYTATVKSPTITGSDVFVATLDGDDVKSGTLSQTTATITYIIPIPTVTSITPNNGVNTGPVNITDLAGTNFQSGATVKLTRAGQPDINGTSVLVLSATKITCTFNLAGAATGAWSVVVANPGNYSGTLTNGFTVLLATTTTTNLYSSVITFGGSVWDTARVTGSRAIPTGTVRFEVSTDSGQTWAKFGAVKTLSRGQATSDLYKPAAAGKYFFRAIYSGNNNYSQSQSADNAEPLTVRKAFSITTTRLSASSINLGSSITDTVTVRGSGPTPTGTVTFQVSTNGGSTWTTFDTKTLSGGVATSDPYKPLAVSNSYRFRALYSGDTNYNGSQSGDQAEPLTVGKQSRLPF